MIYLPIIPKTYSSVPFSIQFNLLPVVLELQQFGDSPGSIHMTGRNVGVVKCSPVHQMSQCLVIALHGVLLGVVPPDPSTRQPNNLGVGRVGVGRPVARFVVEDAHFLKTGHSLEPV